MGYATLPHITMQPMTADFGTSPVMIFEATDQELIAHCLIESRDLPNLARGRRVRRCNGHDFQVATRMSDGRVRLSISAHLVRQRDAGFAKLLAGLAMFVD